MKKENLEQAIDDYKNGTIAYPIFVEKVSFYILNVPKLYRCYDEDVIQEFYLQILYKLKGITGQFTRFDNCKFETWFIHVLKRQFILFYSNYKRKTYHAFIDEVTTIEMEKYIYSPITQEEKLEDLDSMLYFLGECEKNFLYTKYGVNCECLNEEMLNKKKRSAELETKIIKSYSKLLSIQGEINKTQNKIERNELQMKESEIKRKKRNNENRYHSMVRDNSNKFLSKELNISEQTAYSYLSKIKNKAKIHKERIMKTFYK